MKLIKKTYVFIALILLLNVSAIFNVKTSTQTGLKSQESMVEFLNNYFSDYNTDTFINTKSSPVAPRFSEVRNDPAATPATPAAGPKAVTASAPTSTPAAPVAAAASPVPSIDGILQDWFTIASSSFNDPVKFPPVKLPNGSTARIATDGQNRINEMATAGSEPAPNKFSFWFRLSGNNIYYSSSKTDMNVLGAISIQHINSLNKVTGVNDATKNITDCFEVEDADKTKWDICSSNAATIKHWVCRIKNITNNADPSCASETDTGTIKDITVEEVKVTQPIIIIPTPSRTCNEDFNYRNLGNDWECDCKEGREQSPINLPNTGASVPSPVKPFFRYRPIKAKTVENNSDGEQETSHHVKIMLENNVLKIKHRKFGKIVQMDGSVYYAKKITIHTPAEHTIDGKKYDLEVQITHEGVSNSDLAKNVVLSFLFEKHPGFYNKFLDDLDIFNLPNADYPVKDIKNDLSISKIFYSSEDGGQSEFMKPFSFYTYQGSLTAPPCTEGTVHYVVSQPLKIGTTTLQLFQEALRVPDKLNDNTFVVSESFTENARQVQPINGRVVFHYDHQKYCGPDFVEEPVQKERGHTEMFTKVIKSYMYVDGPRPSGIPGAMVVSEAEAKGHM